MKRMRKSVAVLMAVILLYSMIGSSLSVVFAAGPSVKIKVDNYQNGTLDISWSHQLAGVRAAVVSYHKPNPDNTVTVVTSGAILMGNTASISNLQADYIYDISVALYSEVDADNNPVGDPIGRGLLFYLPVMTFSAGASAQSVLPVQGGGFEIGATPKLQISWKVPRIYRDGDVAIYPETDPDSSNNGIVRADTNDALQYINDAYLKIYGTDKKIQKLNYNINISTDLGKIDSGSNQSSLQVEQTLTGYTVKVSHSTSTAAVQIGSDGFASFELWGRADENSTVPTPSGIHVLPDDEILPGTVYYMNIKPVFLDTASVNVDAVTVGKPSDWNGSMLSGERAYTNTPIRFQLTKDSANNIYVKIYKINQGSLDLPRLYYEVQAIDDPSISGDWVVKKTMDDSYFSGVSAVTVITGVNPNNTVYYKIVVKSDSPEDRLESLPLPYTLVVDSSRPPLPTGIAVVDRTLNTQTVTPTSGTSIIVKSSDVTISWDKPLNWSTIKNDLYFHFLLNTSQAEIETDQALFVNDYHWGNYPAKYQLVKYVSAISPKIKEEGNRLTYTINAFDLFTWEDATGNSAGNNIPKLNDTYPDFLIPNTVYYLQMYTTKGSTYPPTDMSDKSIISSFTTLNGVELDVPLPMGFEVSDNGKDTSVSPAAIYIELKMDKIMNLDWNNYTDKYNVAGHSYNIYYDIYMSPHSDKNYLMIGTTENLHGDVDFIGADDIQSTSIKARISDFTTQSAINLFGHKLQPNTTYYFKAKTRLVVKNTTSSAVIVSKESDIFTAVLPVTTTVLVVSPPDDSQRKPLAPTDFSIAVDSDQNQKLSGNKVTFTWKRQENDVVYELIRTTQKVRPADQISSYNSDPEYLSFLQVYSNFTDSGNHRRFYIDPANPTAYGGDFTYDPATKICTFTVDQRMFPNKLYYFSLKTVRVNPARAPLTPSSESVWVSIPVTTSLIEAPASLEVVVKSELGFFWRDDTVGLTAEDYKIYVKGSSDADYKLMTRSQATIVKDKDGETYFGRVTGLKLNSYYDIRVTKGVNTPVFDKTGMKTRDGYHELEIKWIGIKQDNYSNYEIALMVEGSSEYTVLAPTDLEQYVNSNGSILPYYTEETARTVNTDELYYHAKIKSAEVVLAGGITTHQQLRSNTKYYIKVRAVKVDATETDFIAYSKFIGPVDTRTEFNQDDYDNTDREEQQKATFLDRMDQLEKGYYWRVAIGNNSASKILLKGDRVADALRNSSGDSFTIDMTNISVNISTDEIYVPVTVIKAMNSLNKSLVVRTSGAELLLRPDSLDASGNDQFKEILSRQDVKDLYVRLTIFRTTASSTALPSNTARVSDFNELDIQALGLSKTDSDLKKMFHDKLYDKDSGLVSEKLNMLLNTYVGTGTGSSELINQYTQSLVDMIEKELSNYIDSTMQSVKLSNTVKEITTFGAPVSANLTFNSSKGVKLPYVLYDGSLAWQKITTNTVQNSSVRFNLLKTGKYVILVAQSNIGDIPEGHWAESYITSLSSKYDLGDVFAGINNNFMPENKATCREVVLLYEKVIGKSAENTGLDIRQKNARLGLDGIISSNSLAKNVKRQETAAVLLKLFSVKKGVNAASLKPGSRITIKDEGSIGDDYFNPVLMIVDMKIMSLDGSGSFYPGNQMTRAEVVASFAKMLQMTGDLT